MSEKRLQVRYQLLAPAALGAVGVLVWVFGIFPRVFHAEAHSGNQALPLRSTATVDPLAKQRHQDSESVRQKSRDNNLLASNIPVVLTPFQAAPQPTAQDALNRIQQSLEKWDKLVPDVQKTLEEYRQLAREARQALPEIRRTNTALERLIKDVNELVPDTRRLIKGAADTVPDVQKLVKGLNEIVPDVQKLAKGLNDIVPDVQQLVKGLNDTIPVARDTLKDVAVASRNWGQLGERLFVLVGTNEKRINSIVEALDEASRGMARTFSQENTNDVTTLIRNTKTASLRFPGIADESELLLRQSRSTLQKLNDTMKKVDQTFDALNRGMPQTPETNGAIKNLTDASATLNRTLLDLNELVRAISRSDGTLRRFIADPALYNHADDASLMVTRILPRLDRMLKDLEVFADKLARHPESLGLGGVVRPSSGIKDPPRSSFHPRVP
jgi:ABC-type transporter Mla subunit MlaD